MKTDVQIAIRGLRAEEFIDLRKAVGWSYPEDAAAIQTGLDRSILSVCAELEGRVIGFGRIIGDGAFTFYIQDIIVRPEFQRCGIGMNIMTVIMEHIRMSYPAGSMVCLMSAKGKERFYKKFGFFERPNEHFGAGMMLFLE